MPKPQIIQLRHTLAVRLTPEERVLINRAAALAGRKPAAFIRESERLRRLLRTVPAWERE